MVTSSTRKIPESQIPWIPPFSYQKTYDIIILPEVDWIHKKFLILFSFSLGPWGPIIGAKFAVSWEFGPIQVKLWQCMFSSMKMEKYMESDLFCMFWVKLAANTIVLGSPGTQSWAASAVWCLFLKKHTHFRNQTVTP